MKINKIKLGKTKKLRKRGQLFSLDIVVALSTFLLIIIASFYVYNYVSETIQLKESRMDLVRLNHYLASLLTETTGVPANWTGVIEADFNTSISSLGLVKSNSYNLGDVNNLNLAGGLVNFGAYVLDENKIVQLVNFNNTHYEDMKDMLGIVGPNYNFYVDIQEKTINGYQTIYEIGKDADSLAIHVAVEERYALVGNNWTKLIFKSWKGCLYEPCI